MNGQGRHAPRRTRDRPGEVLGPTLTTPGGPGTAAPAAAPLHVANPAQRGRLGERASVARRAPGDATAETAPARAARPEPPRTGRSLVREVSRRQRVLTAGGGRLLLLVLASTVEDTTAVDISSGALIRLRVPWPDDHRPDLSPFDVVEATLADDPERDDLAQPEAATAGSLPRHVGTLHGWRAARMLARLAIRPDGPLLGFPGPSAPYWEFRGFRPSIAVLRPGRGPQLLRRPGDGSTWVRFGWGRDDVWLPVEDPRAWRALDASRRDRLAGKQLATALGFVPHYLLATVSRPRDGHCYKTCTALLPKG